MAGGCWGRIALKNKICVRCREADCKVKRLTSLVSPGLDGLLDAIATTSTRSKVF